MAPYLETVIPAKAGIHSHILGIAHLSAWGVDTALRRHDETGLSR